MSKRTRVYITVDVECRRHSDNYQIPIYGRIGGRRESYGLEFILASLKKYGLKGNFFVEPFFSAKFGNHVLAEVCDRILSDNQDVHLHAHPFFKLSDGCAYKDNLCDYSYNEQVSLIGEAKEILLGCGVPKITAFRTGSFAANNETYAAMESNGIYIASNYNLSAISRGICRIKHKYLFNDAFIVQKVLELPVTCFYEFDVLRLRTMLRPMQLTAVSFAEMEYVINAAPRYGINNVVVLVHPFEFLSFSGTRDNKVSVNRVNVRRFIELCEMLKENVNTETGLISELDDRRPDGFTPSGGGVPSTPFRLSCLGKIEQLKKRLIR